MENTPHDGDGGSQLRLVPSRAEEIAWAAGLWEGEGCWNAYFRPGTSKVNVQARLAMTDRDVVEKFARVVGFGTVRDRKRPTRPQEKPVIEWYTQKRANVRLLIEMFIPYLGERRLARANEVLAHGEARPMNERTHCREGHPYEGDNVMFEPKKYGDKTYMARRCRICRTEQNRLRARARRAKEKALSA